MDELDYDIYSDLDGALTEPLEEDKIRQQEAEKARIEDEKRTKVEIEEKISKVQKENSQLKKNMSMLLATAKSEIERKDQQIKQLRKELDDLIFRKTKVSKVVKRDKCIQTNFSALHDKFTQTSESISSRDPVDRLKVKKDQNNAWKSRERDRSRERDYRDGIHDRRGRSPPKRSPERSKRHIDQSKHKNRHESPKRSERSPDRVRKNDPSKPRSRYESSEIKRSSSRDRNSSKEKDSRHDRDRVKSPSRRESDLRAKILDKRSRDVKTETKIIDDVKSATNYKEELKNQDCKSEKKESSIKQVNDDEKISKGKVDVGNSKENDKIQKAPDEVNKQKCEQKTITKVADNVVEKQRKSTRSNNDKSNKQSDEKSTDKKTESKERDQKSTESPKSNQEDVNKKKRSETPKKSKTPKKAETGIKENEKNDSSELLKILTNTLNPNEVVTQSEKEVITSEGNLDCILKTWAATEEIQNTPDDESNKIITSENLVEVEIVEYSEEVFTLNTNDQDVQENISVEPPTTSQKELEGTTSDGNLISEQIPRENSRLCIVPMEIGSQYEDEKPTAILELPANNEEVIFDSRSLSAQDTPVKSPENESFDSTKENNSLNTSGKGKKRKIVTTEVEEDGTVVFTITRKKKRKTTKS